MFEGSIEEFGLSYFLKFDPLKSTALVCEEPVQASDVRRVVKMTAKTLVSKPSAYSGEIKDNFKLSFELSKQIFRPLSFDNRDDKNSPKNHQVISMK